MRVENTQITRAGDSRSSEPVQPTGAGRRDGLADGEISADTVALSNASSLIGLAKHLQSADRQSRLTQLASQVQTGTYRVNAHDVSRALIQDLV